MDNDENVVNMNFSRKRRNRITDHEKLVLAYHAFEQNNPEEAMSLLNAITQDYYLIQFHKDISRALLCWITYKSTQVPELGKESEFYQVVYQLTKRITGQKMVFPKSGHFYDLRETLFKGFGL